MTVSDTLEELDRFAKIIWSAAQVLIQDILTECYIVKIATNMMEFSINRLQGGPISLIQETLDTFFPLIEDRGLSIKVVKQVFDLPMQEASIDWQIYKSILHHQVHNAIINSPRGSSIVINAEFTTGKTLLPLVKATDSDKNFLKTTLEYDFPEFWPSPTDREKDGYAGGIAKLQKQQKYLIANTLAKSVGGLLHSECNDR